MQPTRRLFPVVLVALVIAFGKAQARAETLNFTVTMDTTALQSSTDSFYLDWALSGSDGNTVTVSNFNFGANGSAGPTSSILEIGDASGGISVPNGTASVDSSGGYQVNDFSQGFTPGEALSFDVSGTEMPGNSDAFLFSIYDGNSLLPTDGPNGEFLSIRYDGGTPVIANYGSSVLGITAPSVTYPATIAPLPSAARSGLCLLAFSALLLGRARHVWS